MKWNIVIGDIVAAMMAGAALGYVVGRWVVTR
jgi:membrane protein DedA with SNARE-associated domain